MPRRPRSVWPRGGLVLALALLLPAPIRASCGAQSCPLDLHGGHGADGPFSLDLSWQYVRQDQVRVGTREGTVGELPSPEDEVSTVSRVSSAMARLAIAERWSVSATLPFVQRTHEHVRNQAGQPPLPEAWDFSGLGDASLMTEWRASGARSPVVVGLQAGVKLPTGRRHVDEVAGDEPEPPARPGTGSWDGVAGLHVMRAVSLPALAGGRVEAPLFMSALGRLNGHGTDDYRAGDELQLNLGATYPLAGAVRLLAQVNARLRGPDDPGRTDALQADTGGAWVYASPGLRVEAGHGIAPYAYVQLPVWQRVNRIQIVAPWMLYTGLSWTPAR